MTSFLYSLQLISTHLHRYFFKSLHEGWLRHGIAEIIKMSVTKDYELFTLLEKVGPKLIRTKFGTTKDTSTSAVDPAFEADCDLIVGRALDSYVKSEYGNLWETHQCRPHAYGHTWSPGYELSSGMLHGHAVATGMGFGAFLARERDWITESDYRRVLGLISAMELALWHPVMDEVDMIWGSQVKMVQKRGGNLCAPLPRGSLGVCGYLNDLSYEQLRDSLAAYKQVCSTYPRGGLGIDMHCADVGLEDPSVTARSHVKNETNGAMDTTKKAADGKALTYNDWIKSVQTERNAEWKFNVSFDVAKDTAKPPTFEHVTLFQAGAEQYAMDMTSVPSTDVQRVAKATMEQDMFAPCMVGTLESQFLKLQASLTGAKACLDVGTFTGMSAVALAEGVPADGRVVTLEFDEKIADVAQANFDAASVGKKITMMRGSAVDSMKALKAAGEKFDIVFLDADKERYVEYYELAMDGLLSENGFIMADNSLCALLYDAEDSRSVDLHRFNQHVKNDARVEQVVLTMREGVTVIRPVRK